MNNVEFINYVSQAIDQKIAANQMPSVFKKKEEGPLLSLQACCSRIMIDHCDLKGMDTHPVDLQVSLLERAHSFQEWTSTARYLSPEAIDRHAKKLLMTLGNDFTLWNRMRGTTPREKLLNHMFKELVIKSTKEEVDVLLAQQRKIVPLIEATVSRTSLVAEEIFGKLSAFFGSRLVQFALACVTARYTWSYGHKLINHISHQHIPRLVNLIINHAPVQVIRIATVLYDYKGRIGWICFFGALVAPSGSIPGRLFKGVSYILDIPRKIASLPFNMACKAYTHSFTVASYANSLLAQGRDQAEAQRLDKELKSAQHYWGVSVV